MNQTEERLQALRERCSGCTDCPLHAGRTQVVFGTGEANARVLLVGEGPGKNEDLQGEPFVGRSGRLLDTMLLTVDLSRKVNLYIANIVKCRPPENRDPKPEESQECIRYLREQVAIIRPQIIVCLGRIAAMQIIKPDFRITAEHGQWTVRGGVHMMGTFHPAALLRNPKYKEDAFADLLGLREKIRELCPETYSEENLQKIALL